VVTVRYEQVNSMLLNSSSKSHKKVQSLGSHGRAATKRMEVLTAQLKETGRADPEVERQLK